jgi:sugar/nucleoside kinase (ribokinase family)
MRLLGIGDNVVDRYNDLGRFFPGGNALNVAVAARKAGADAAYVGALGNDEAGRVVLEALQAEGVATDRIRIVEGANAYAEVAIENGERVFVGSDIGVSRFELDETELAYAATFDRIHTGDSSMLEPQLADLAASAPVSFDFSIRREPGYVDPLIGYVDIAIFSAADLSDDATVALVAGAVGRGPRLALATRGSAPAVLHDGRHVWRQPVVATQVVDTLGAGDAFIGRFLVGIGTGEDPAVSLEAAAHAAAITCADFGAFGHGHPLLTAPDQAETAARRLTIAPALGEGEDPR